MNTTTEQTAVAEPRTRLRRFAFAAVAVPALMVGLALPANAAELTPIAEALDATLASTLSSIGAALDALGLAA
ncbi:hypothetical protein GCM10027271_58140 [Saccharopolyspora gloriosae]|uniref:Putative NIF3 family GTP cyclohydrolase 1 type 2 n=1 Tax=Saccharopolyspora gloriosae TaxID=455344 RepID=A0A840N7F5_9PSEU|nr:hypothetical protein [Saccharopolyspora gloriosae]MBB5067900.1 putative NIF3 family GTP cyclohydrolase 1 type 2 [Saccharopolyspora gloriosae]